MEEDKTSEEVIFKMSLEIPSDKLSEKALMQINQRKNGEIMKLSQDVCQEILSINLEEKLVKKSNQS